MDSLKGGRLASVAEIRKFNDPATHAGNSPDRPSTPLSRHDLGLGDWQKCALQIVMSTRTPTGEIIVTRIQKVWLRQDGLLHAENISREMQTLADAQQILAACRQLAGGVIRPIYIDTTIAGPVSPEAQAEYTSAEAASIVNAIAILTKHWAGRLIGNFVLERQRKEVPMRLFQEESVAVEWLQGHLRISASR